MDFFSAQDQARRKTWQLGALFALAVLSLVALTNVLMYFVWQYGAGYGTTAMMLPSEASYPVGYAVATTIAVLAVIGIASTYKFLTVRAGGKAIAEALGGSPLTYEAADFKERRLLNIVEEMAIASGIPVPPVYLIPEQSINAFAAGFNHDDAVVGINRGTLDALNREELQGVVAHEFSHILNGDTGINLKLIALLHGILFIGMIGYGILRYGTGYRGRRSEGGALPVVALAIGLVVIGYGGTFFGRIIKAAVSRQREYLADAAAVQFTRNPGGIAGALKKIGGSTVGSTITNPRAEESSHMFFGQIATTYFRGLFATHPRLDKRIRAIDPNWDGKYPYVGLAGDVTPAADAELTTGFAEATASSPSEMVTHVGELHPSALDATRAHFAQTPSALVDATHSPFSARALVYAMLIDGDQATVDQQFGALQEHAADGIAGASGSLWAALDSQTAVQRIVLLERAMPALKNLTQAQYQRFVGNVTQLIKADREISLFEWVLYRILIKELKPSFESVAQPRVRFDKLELVANQAATVLHALAKAAAVPDDQVKQLLADNELAPTAETGDDKNFARLNKALQSLRELHPLQKPRLLKMSAVLLESSNQSDDAVALLHGICATLDCPLPVWSINDG